MASAMAHPGSSSAEMKLTQQYRKPRILLAASGCLDAVNFGHLCRCFSEWAVVKAVTTKASLHFIDRASFPINVPMYTDEDEWRIWNRIGDHVLHIDLQAWADIMVIAPLSANTLSKMAGGICDNLLTCIVRAWDYEKPMFVAPSMNTLMWNSELTERHLSIIDDFGAALIRPGEQRLASGEYGTGTMEEISQINTSVKLYIEKQSGKKTDNG